MNFKLGLILITLLIIPFTFADNVAVVVDFPDGSKHYECIESSEGNNGYELLNKLSLSTVWSNPGGFGHQLCQINGIGDSVSGTGCSFSGKYWRFLNGINSAWEYLPVGFDGGSACWNGDLSSFDGHYCVKDGDVIGLSYGEFTDSRPAFKDFESICQPLKVKEIKVYVDGNRESDADKDGGDIEAEPGDELEFKIELENIFDFDNDLEIENIEAEITIKDIDDNSDIEESVDFKDIEEGDEEKEEISIEIPLRLDDDNYDIELKITGETSEGVDQEIIINYDLEIDKEKHDLKFSKLDLTYLNSCPNEKNTLLIEVTNIGEKDEDDVFISAKNSDLKLDFSDRFDVEEGEDDSTYRKEVPFTIPNIESGDYKIDLVLDYSDTTRRDITLTINDCKDSKITGNVINENKITTKKPTQATPNYQPVLTQEFFEAYAIPILLAIFLLFLIIAIVYIISIL